MAIKAEVVDAVHKIGADLRTAGVRVAVDDRVDTPFGRRAVDWELKGVPLRVEVGPRDVESGTAMLAHRIVGGKAPFALADLVAAVPQGLADDQTTLLAEATTFRDTRTADVDSLADAVEATKDGWAKLPWEKLGIDGEADLAQSAVTVRCLQRPDGTVPDRNDEPELIAFVARSY
jgi:prolyl-tRNA synthetase